MQPELTECWYSWQANSLLHYCLFALLSVCTHFTLVWLQTLHHQSRTAQLTAQTHKYPSPSRTLNSLSTRTNIIISPSFLYPYPHHLSRCLSLTIPFVSLVTPEALLGSSKASPYQPNSVKTRSTSFSRLASHYTPPHLYHTLLEPPSRTFRTMIPRMMVPRPRSPIPPPPSPRIHPVPQSLAQNQFRQRGHRPMELHSQLR